MQTKLFLRVSLLCRFQSFKDRAVLIAIEFQKYVLGENIRDSLQTTYLWNPKLSISHKIKTSLFISSRYPTDVERLFSHLNVYLNVPLSMMSQFYSWNAMHSNWRPVLPLNHMSNCFILSCDDLQVHYSCGVLRTIWIRSSQMLFN